MASFIFFQVKYLISNLPPPPPFPSPPRLPLLCNLTPTDKRVSALGELMVSAIRYCGRVSLRRSLVLGTMLMLKRPNKKERARIIELLEEAGEGGGGGMMEEVIVPAAMSIMEHQVEEIRVLAANVVGKFGGGCREGFRGKEIRERMEEVVRREKNKVVLKAIITAGKEVRAGQDFCDFCDDTSKLPLLFTPHSSSPNFLSPSPPLTPTSISSHPDPSDPPLFNNNAIHKFISTLSL